MISQKTCDFVEFTDQMIRDQVVEKTNSAKIRERLLMEKDLTLSKAREIAHRVENAVLEARALSQGTESNSTSPAVNKVSRYAKNSPRPKTRTKAASRPTVVRENKTEWQQCQRACFRCASTQHLANDPSCPAKDKTCNKCNKVGH